MKLKKLILTGIVAVAALTFIGIQFNRTANCGLGSIRTSTFSTNDVMGAIREMYSERGWETVYARGTPESWTHIAKDKKGRQVVIRIKFDFLKSNTEVIMPDNPDYSITEITKDLASRLGIVDQSKSS